jgi:hypothetical protein
MNAKLALAALGLLTAPGLTLADNGTCSSDSIVGTYGFSGSGTVLSSNTLGLPEGSAVATGLMTFEKDGRIHGTEMISFNGVIASGVTFTGTYVLNPDCTLTLDDPGFFHDFGVLVAGGKEILLMQADHGVIARFTMKRLDKR